MKVKVLHAVKLQSMKWTAVGFGAALLFCTSSGFAQSLAKSETKKETVEVSSPSIQPPVAAKTKEPVIATDGNGRVSQASFRIKTAGVFRDSEQSRGPQTKTVRIWDACDPDTFNAAVGPGTCIPGHHGQTKFQDFFAELDLDKIAGGWRFNPLLNATDGAFKLVQLELESGDRISLQNVGGETHTFTRVAEYAGGFFDPLNGRTGNPTPAPECARVLPDGTLAPQPESDTNQFVEAATTETGPLAGTPVLPLGVTHWQCCIHPWMRLNVAVRDHNQDQGHSQQQ